MQIGKLDHVNVRTNQLDSMNGWYTNVLGMRAGDRPDFPFPGTWWYAGDAAAIHLVGVEGGSGAGSELDLKLERFAFSATGRAEHLLHIAQNHIVSAAGQADCASGRDTALFIGVLPKRPTRFVVLQYHAWQSPLALKSHRRSNFRAGRSSGDQKTRLPPAIVWRCAGESRRSFA